MPIRRANPTQLGDAISDRKLCNYKKENFEKRVNGVKATDNHIVSRPQESNSKKLSTAGIDRKVTLCTTKSKMPAIKECTNNKTRPSDKPTGGQPSIKQTKILARVYERAKTRVYERAETSIDERAYTDPSNWDPGW